MTISRTPEEAAQRARSRRTLLLLVGVVVALVASVLGYVLLYDSFLRDPDRPRVISAEINPRALAVELALLAVVALVVTAWIRRRGGKDGRRA